MCGWLIALGGWVGGVFGSIEMEMMEKIRERGFFNRIVL